MTTMKHAHARTGHTDRGNSTKAQAVEYKAAQGWTETLGPGQTETRVKQKLKLVGPLENQGSSRWEYKGEIDERVRE